MNTVVEEGNPATEILGQADTGEYDLVLVGATGASDVRHEMLGSVSSKVAAQAPCSVVVVKEVRRLAIEDPNRRTPQALASWSFNFCLTKPSW